MAIFVIGRQRSGTTVFRYYLSSNPRFVDVGEILHDRFLKGQVRDTEERFYRYLHDLVLTNPEVIHPGHHGRLLADFLQDVELRHAGRYVVIDVKYNLLFMITQNRLYHKDRPALFDILLRRKDLTIHIIRRNKLRLLVSERMANATGQWSLTAKAATAPIKAKIELNPDTVLHLIQQELEVETVITNLLQKLCHIRTLYYEDLIDAQGIFKEIVEEKVGKFLGESFKFSREPKIVKQNPEPLSDIIANHDAVLAQLEKSPFEWMWYAP
jgi:hypothetical protein